ncbi:TetR family transcriptional regulator [Herbihabitans rhizosphaerae]|uniref:TetR family transcriptional regulator n=1 Tax=Herbihabitans rhizosphaerae TaxID=1872711 RepID=A0A4Q7KUQ1_9PSEU|nr:TetR family transcriptional regulator [Herbihabitans rhizosphaerae]
MIAAARELFAARGYADVPADEIVKAAGVTRGALYHHFDDKQKLFRAVVEQLEAEITAELRELVAGAPDIATVTLAALSAYLDICGRPEVRRLALTDAPTVLGWKEWRALQADHGLGLIADILRRAMDENLVARQRVDVLAQLVLSTVTEAGLIVASADDPAAVRPEVERSLGLFFSALFAGQSG